MKTCNSSRVTYHQHIISSNVPTKLEDRDSTKARCRTFSTHHTNKSFGFNSSSITKCFIICVTLSLTLHLCHGSHLPSSYLVQKANSNNNHNTTSNANTQETTTPTSSASSSTTTVTEDIPSSSFGGGESIAGNNATTESQRVDDTRSNQVNNSMSTLSQETTSQQSPLPTTTLLSNFKNSKEDSVETNVNYVSEHDHYDEYAAMKAALQKEKQSSEETKAEKPVVERRPYLLQAADGRKYASIEALCDDRQMTIYGNFVDIFKGRMYALGYSDELECGTSNAKQNSHNITFVLPLGSCGVQMMAVDDNLENDLRHEVTLYIQYSAFLQQIVDEKITVTCTEVKRTVMDEFIASNEEAVISNRQGRRMGNLGETGKYGTTKISSRIGESWMEILAGKDPSPKSRKLSPVSVGEDVTLVISTKVMRGYDARIVNCSAHDGSRTGTIDGSRAQQILDSAGCSLDRSLVPNLRRRRLPIESRNRLITLHFATFPAFKFPERDHLHIKCAVAYCQGPCPQEPCDSVLNHFGSWRDKYGRIADVLIDSTEVVNSVEVIAPDLDELSSGNQYDRHQPMAAGSYSSLSSGNLPPAPQSEISGRQFSSDHASSYHAYSASNGAAPQASAASSGQSMYGNGQLHQINPSGDLHGVGNSVCVSPGTVILALVILGVVLVISATATLWFALKRSEAKKYRHVKHSPFQHGPQPYYRFSHW